MEGYNRKYLYSSQSPRLNTHVSLSASKKIDAYFFKKDGAYFSEIKKKEKTFTYKEISTASSQKTLSNANYNPLIQRFYSLLDTNFIIDEAVSRYKYRKLYNEAINRTLTQKSLYATAEEGMQANAVNIVYYYRESQSYPAYGSSMQMSAYNLYKNVYFASTAYIYQYDGVRIKKFSNNKYSASQGSNSGDVFFYSYSSLYAHRQYTPAYTAFTSTATINASLMEYPELEYTYEYYSINKYYMYGFSKRYSLILKQLLPGNKPSTAASYTGKHKSRNLSSTNISFLLEAHSYPVVAKIYYLESPLITMQELSEIYKAKAPETAMINSFYNKINSDGNYYQKMPYPSTFEQLAERISGQKSNSFHVYNSNLEKLIDKYLVENSHQHKKQPKSRLLKNPSNINEVHALSKWLDLMLARLKSEEGTSVQQAYELFDKLYLLYAAAFKELVRYISTDSSERALLLERVWNAHTYLINLGVQYMNTEWQHSDKESIEEVSRLHKMYQYFINVSEGDRQKYTKNYSTELEKNKKLLEYVQYLKKSNTIQVRKFKKAYLEIDYLYLLNENLYSDVYYLRKELEMAYLSEEYQVINPIYQSPIAENASPKGYQINYIEIAYNEQYPVVVRTIREIRQHIFMGGEYVLERDGRISVKSQCDFNSFYDTHSLYYALAATEHRLKISISYAENELDLDDYTTGFKANVDELSFDLVNESTYVNAYNLRGFLVESSTQTNISNVNAVLRDQEVYRHNKSNYTEYKRSSYSTVVTVHRQTQTSLLTEYEMITVYGLDIYGVSKIETSLEVSEEYFEQLLSESSLNAKIKMNIYTYMSNLARLKRQMREVMNEEVGLKLRYFEENIQIKLKCNDLETEVEELKDKEYKLTEELNYIESDSYKMLEAYEILQKSKTKLEARITKAKAVGEEIYLETNDLFEELNGSQVVVKYIREKIYGARPSANISSFASKSRRSSYKYRSSYYIPLYSLEGSYRTSLSILKEVSAEYQADTKIQSSNLISDRAYDTNPLPKSHFSRLANYPPANERPSVVSNTSDDDNHRKYLIDKLRQAVLKIYTKLFSDSPSSSSGSSRSSSADHSHQNQSISNTSIRVYDEGQSNDKNAYNNNFTRIYDAKRNSQNFLRPLVPYSHKITIPKAPKFHKKDLYKKLLSQNTKYADAILYKTVQKFASKYAKPLTTVKNICKYIGQMYCDRMKVGNTRNDPFHIFCYDHFLAHFGLKRVAESKIVYVYETVFALKNKYIPRIYLFGRFLRLYYPYVSDELEYYLDTLQKLEDSVHGKEHMPGLAIASYTSESVRVSLEKCVEVLRGMEESIGKYEMMSSIELIDKRKKYDSYRNAYTVDLDFFMYHMIDLYVKVRNSRQDLHNIFDALDIDKDESMQLYEFLCALYYLQNFNEEQLHHAEKIFLSKWDKCDEQTQEKSLSLQRFVTICVEHNWFRSFNLKLFLESNSYDYVYDFISLYGHWPKCKQNIEMRLYSVNKLSGFYKRAIKKIHKTLQSTDISSNTNLQMTTILTYKIVELESRRMLLVEKVKDFLTNDLCSLQLAIYKTLELHADEGDMYSGRHTVTVAAAEDSINNQNGTEEDFNETNYISFDKYFVSTNIID